MTALTLTQHRTKRCECGCGELVRYRFVRGHAHRGKAPKNKRVFTAAQRRERDRFFRSKYREKRRAYMREWDKKNTEKRYARQRRRLLAKYGLTTETHDSMVAAQGGVCLICRRQPPLRRTCDGRQYRQFDVDHCHKTNRVRGLLCCNCNAILGHARDGVEILRAAIAYLEAHQ